MTSPRDTKRRQKRIESALRIIYTWATYKGGIALDPRTVAELCERALGRETGKEKS